MTNFQYNVFGNINGLLKIDRKLNSMQLHYDATIHLGGVVPIDEFELRSTRS